MTLRYNLLRTKSAKHINRQLRQTGRHLEPVSLVQSRKSQHYLALMEHSQCQLFGPGDLLHRAVLRVAEATPLDAVKHASNRDIMFCFAISCIVQLLMASIPRLSRTLKSHRSQLMGHYHMLLAKHSKELPGTHALNTVILHVAVT